MDPFSLPFLQKTDQGIYLLVKVQPGAKKNELCGESEGMLRIRLAAPAVDNKANKALIGFMAETLNVKRNKIVLVSGEKSRKKKLLFSPDSAPLLEALLSAET